MRLLALLTEQGVYSSSFEDEQSLEPEDWQDTISGHDHQVFGLFDGDELIGITGVFTWHEDATAQTALFAMTFILADYRGQGLARLLYESRLAWVRERPRFTRIIASHRETNDVSRRANQRHGFRIKGKSSRRWPDGKTEDEVIYELIL